MAKKQSNLPRGVDRLPNGRLRVRMRVDGNLHTIGTFGTVTDARAAYKIAEGEKARGTFVPPAEKRRKLKEERAARQAQATADTRTVRDLAAAWIEWQEHRGLKIGSVYTYRRTLEAHFLETFGTRHVGDVTAVELNDWLDRLERDMSASGAAQVHRVVAAMFRWATGDAKELPRGFAPWLLTSPVPPLAARRLNRPNLPTRNREVFTAGDIARLAVLMPYREDRMIVLISGWAALRLGEVLALRRRHVTTDDDGVTWIRVDAQVQARGSGVREETPKSAAGYRSVPVPNIIAPALHRHLDTLPSAPDALLFPRRGGGNRLNNPNTVRKRFNLALSRLNANRARGAKPEPPYENSTFHGLRHAALTRLGQAGATTAELKAYAGHADGKSVEIYQHAEKRRLAAVASTMGQ